MLIRSIQEIVYYFGSGRSGIIMISFLVFNVFASNNIFIIGTFLIINKYLDFLSLELEIIITAIYDGEFGDFQKQTKNIIMVFLGIILYPMCLIKDFHNIKVR